MEQERNTAGLPGAVAEVAPPADEPPVWTARKLVRAARSGVLATVDDGQPFASLVTPACAPDLSPLMLLSSLSPHTRHLRAEPRCSLLVTGTAPEPNPQTAPRLTLVGRAVPEPEPAAKARWLAVHPYASLYAHFTDFTVFRLVIESANFVGGFARAARFTAAQLLPDARGVEALSEAEPSIVGHCNADHPDALARMASRRGLSSGAWQMVTADVDGCDLALGDLVIRIDWTAPASSPTDVRRELIALARER